MLIEPVFITSCVYIYMLFYAHATITSCSNLLTYLSYVLLFLGALF